MADETPETKPDESAKETVKETDKVVDDATPAVVKETADNPVPVPDPPKNTDNIDARLSSIEAQIADLASKITETVAAPVVEPGSDENPVKPPWHKGGFFR